MSETPPVTPPTTPPTTPGTGGNSESSTGSVTVWQQILTAITYGTSVLRYFANPASAGFALIALVVPMFTVGLAMWDGLFARIDQIAVASTGQMEFRPFGFANHVLPLAEFCTALLGWAALYVLCNTIRIIKSFIPTVA